MSLPGNLSAGLMHWRKLCDLRHQNLFVQAGVHTAPVPPTPPAAAPAEPLKPKSLAPDLMAQTERLETVR